MIKTVTVELPYSYYDEEGEWQSIHSCDLQSKRFKTVDDAAESIRKSARQHCEVSSGQKFLGNVLFKINTKVYTYSYSDPSVHIRLKVRYDREMSADEIEKEKVKQEKRKEKIQADIEELKLRGEKVKEKIAKLEAKV